MVAEDYLEYMYSKGYYDNSRELQNKNIFGENHLFSSKIEMISILFQIGILLLAML